MSGHNFTPQPGCVTCGHYGSYDNELILDDEGDVFCEECWNP